MTSLSFQQEKELDYYKEENRKLAGRIDELISMNNTMKEMIKQSPSKNNKSDYWKQEATNLYEVNQDLEEKLKRLKKLLQK